MKKIILISALVVVLLAAGGWYFFQKNSTQKQTSQITPTQKTATSADNAPSGSIHNLPVPDAVAAVKASVSQKTGVPVGEVIILTAYEKEWPNSCLGLAKSNEMCAEVITPGYEITAQAGGKEFYYRTNSDGSVMRSKE